MPMFFDPGDPDVLDRRSRFGCVTLTLSIEVCAMNIVDPDCMVMGGYVCAGA
jgi:hypothetical protein